MNKATKFGLFIGGATATITTVYFLKQKNRTEHSKANVSKRLDELAQPSNEQAEKMVSEGAQTTINYVNRLQNLVEA